MLLARLQRAAFISLIIASALGFIFPSFATAGQTPAHAPDRNSHHQLKEFEQFLDKNPTIAADLKKDPSLVNNKDYLTKHPDLQKFVETHPGLLQELLAKDESCSIPIPSIFDLGISFPGGTPFSASAIPSDSSSAWAVSSNSPW